MSEARTYRVILEADIYVEVEHEDEWDNVETELEASLSWEVFHDNWDHANVDYAEVDSYVEE